MTAARSDRWPFSTGGNHPNRDLWDDACYALHYWSRPEIQKRLSEIPDAALREDMRRTLNAVIDNRKHWEQQRDAD